MKRAEGREQSSVLFLGKGIIIVSLVLISSVTFVLGYFVGKNTNSHEETTMQIAPAPIPYEQTTAGTEGQEPQASPPEYTERTGDRQQPFHSDEVVELIENTEKSGQHSSASRKNITDTSGGTQTQEQKKAVQPPQGKQAGSLTSENRKTLKYTVQVGAFKNESDARILSEKLEKKGYNTQMIVTQEKSREKLFKVMVGAFIIRKDADILALKLKKSEGLKAFVTFHKNTEGIR
ncbi:MAG: SPOR domain-containing protein [Thermodesulfovibrionales bacterium]|nr:SPOR domain-containing protein [Thermodesulfovibrionales bacterium]